MDIDGIRQKWSAILNFVKDPDNKTVVLAASSVVVVSFLYVAYTSTSRERNNNDSKTTTNTTSTTSTSTTTTISTTAETPLPPTPPTPTTSNISNTNNNNNSTTNGTPVTIVSPPSQSHLKASGTLSTQTMLDFLKQCTTLLQSETSRLELHHAIVGDNRKYDDVVHEIITEQTWITFDIDPTFGKLKLSEELNNQNEQNEQNEQNSSSSNSHTIQTSLGRAMAMLTEAKVNARPWALLGETEKVDQYHNHRKAYRIRRDFFKRKFKEQYASMIEETTDQKMVQLWLNQIRDNYLDLRNRLKSLGERGSMLAEMTLKDEEIQKIGFAEGFLALKNTSSVNPKRTPKSMRKK